MPDDNPADQTDKSGLTPEERALINDGIIIGANAAGVALALAGIPGTGPLLAGVGSLLFGSFAPGKSPEAAYYEALSEQIAEMESVLLDGLFAISEQVKALQTELTEIYIKMSLRIELDVYNSCKAVIDQYYSDFVDHLRGLSEQKTNKEAVEKEGALLFELFQTRADAVAIKMRVLHDTLMDGADGTQGLISLQKSFVISKVDDWIADPANYGLGQQSYGRSGSMKAYRCMDIVTAAYGAAGGDAIRDFVQPFINSILTLQYRGLTLLITAWAKSDYTDQLKVHVDNAKHIVEAIQDLISVLGDPEVIDATIKSAIAKTGFRRTPQNFVGNPYGENFVDLANWVEWNGWSGHYFDSPQTGAILEVVNVGDDVTFNASYPTWTLYPTAAHGKYYGWMHAVASQTTIPAPSSRAPQPLTDGLGLTASVLTQTLAQTSGPRIVLDDVPPPAGGLISGRVRGLSDAHGAEVHVFEYYGPGWWLPQAPATALSADGGFSAAVSGNGAQYWCVLLTKPGWIWMGGTARAAPAIGPDVLVYITTPAATVGSSPIR